MDSTLFPHCNLLRVKLKNFLICDIFLDAWPSVSSSLTRMKSWTKERFPKIFIIWCPFDFWGLFLSITTSVTDSCYYGNWLLSVQIFLLSLIFFKESTLLFFFYWIKPAIINIAEPEVFLFPKSAGFLFEMMQIKSLSKYLKISNNTVLLNDQIHYEIIWKC